MANGQGLNLIESNEKAESYLEYFCLERALRTGIGNCPLVIDAQTGCNLHRAIENFLHARGEHYSYIDVEALLAAPSRASQEEFIENLSSIFTENNVFIPHSVKVSYSEAELWTQFLRQCANMTHAPGIYIIFERFTLDNNLFNDFLLKLERYIGQWCHFIFLMNRPLSGRERDTLLFERMHCITHRDFLLTIKEGRACLESNGVEVSERSLQTIWLATAGWSFPTDLLIHKSKYDPNILNNIQICPINSILYLPELYTFFQKLLFAQMDEPEKELLMKSAVDNCISDSYCAFLEIQMPAAASIAKIAGKSPYIACMNAFEQIYTINPVAQSFLYHSSRQKYGEARIAALHAKAASYYQSRQDWKRVLSHHLLQGNIREAAYAFRFLSFDMTNTFLSEGYKELVRRTPISVLETDSWVQFAYAVTIKYQYPDIALQYLSQALSGFSRSEDVEGEILAFCQTVSIGFFSEAHKSVVLNKEMLLRFYTAPDGSICEDVILDSYRKVFLAYAHIQLGDDIGAAAIWLKEARQTSVILQDQNLHLWVDFIYIRHYANRSDSQQLKFYVTEALELAETKSVQMELKMYLYQTSAFGYFIKCGLYEQACSYCEEARILAHSIGATSYLIYISLIYTYALDCLRKFDLAEEILLETESIVQNILNARNEHLRAYYMIGQAYHYYLKGGDWQTAFYAADNAINLSRRSKRNSYLARALLVMGSIQIEKGHFEKTKDCIAECLSICTSEKYYFYRLSALYQQALLCQKGGEAKQFTKQLQAVLEEARNAEIYHFNFTPPWDIPLHIADAGINQSNDKYVTNLCSRNSVMLSERMKLRGLGKEKELRFQLFGSFHCYRKNSEIAVTITQKAHYLLELLAVSSSPIGIAKIVEELWPNQNQKQAMNNFYFALHQIRKVLGNKSFVRYEQKRCWLDRDCYTTDLEEFSYWKKCGEEACKHNEYDEGLFCFETAMNLYGGTFLEDAALESTLAADRYAIEREAYNFCKTYGTMLLQKGEARKGAEVLRKASYSEFAQEEIYRLLMVACYMLGDRGEVRKVYQVLEHKLAVEMDAVPDLLSRQVYEAIKDEEHPKSILKNICFKMELPHMMTQRPNP